MYSAVLIVPESLLIKANKLGEAMGWGPTNYTIPLMDAEGAVFYGLRTDVQPSFLGLLQNAATGVVPDLDYLAYDLTPQDVQDIVAELKASFSPDPINPDSPTLWGSDHFAAALETFGLTQK